MSRRNISKKRFPKADSTYDSYLVSLLVTRILKSGKKNLAQNIVNSAFDIIKSKSYKVLHQSASETNFINTELYGKITNFPFLPIRQIKNCL